MEQAIRDQEPVFALTTAMGMAPVAIIRVSGSSIFPLIKKHLSNRAYPINQLVLTKLFDEQKAQLDEPMVVFFQGPHSFTGQDVVELHVHGSPYVVKQVFALLSSLGIRQALPGEFSKRAYLNGKMDLAKAEGVAQLISAESQQQWKAAQSLLQGKLSKHIKALRDSLVDASMYLEAQIDFPDEEDVAHLTLQKVDGIASNIQAQTQQLIDSYDSAKVLKDGLRVAIVGPPNAGKSTLLNTFLAQERAIVTATPGTTRDYLEERRMLRGRLISFIDTAGIRQTQDEIEQQGISMALDLAEAADLVIVLLPVQASVEDKEVVDDLLQKLPNEKCLFVRTKVDLADSDRKPAQELAISCLKGSGVEELVQMLTHRVDRCLEENEDKVYISNLRHLECLKQAMECLLQYQKLRQEDHYEEVLAVEVRRALFALEEVIGSVTRDDVLGAIFSGFCIGK